MALEPISAVSYEMLESIEEGFEKVEVELIRHQAKLSQHLYAKREKMVADIDNFWPLVFEASPPDIDNYIQPSDSALLLGNLKSLSVDRFELPDGDPRSVAFRFEFAENDYFEDKVLEKKFWYRHSKRNWSGLVSEPVDIKWKSADKDLTGGMLGLARRVWEEDRAGKKGVETEAKKQLKEKMNKTGLGGVSFFAWFGFRGCDVSAEENREAQAEEKKRESGKDDEEKAKAADEMEDEEEEEEEEEELELEIFPTADELAIAIADDLWPNAIKYFIQAHEQDKASDAWFESDGDDEKDEEDGGEEDDAADEGRPQKKRKA